MPGRATAAGLPYEIKGLVIGHLMECRRQVTPVWKVEKRARLALAQLWMLDKEFNALCQPLLWERVHFDDKSEAKVDYFLEHIAPLKGKWIKSITMYGSGPARFALLSKVVSALPRLNSMEVQSQMLSWASAEEVEAHEKAWAGRLERLVIFGQINKERPMPFSAATLANIHTLELRTTRQYVRLAGLLAKLECPNLRNLVLQCHLSSSEAASTNVPVTTTAFDTIILEGKFDLVDVAYMGHLFVNPPATVQLFPERTSSRDPDLLQALLPTTSISISTKSWYLNPAPRPPAPASSRDYYSKANRKAYRAWESWPSEVLLPWNWQN